MLPSVSILATEVSVPYVSAQVRGRFGRSEQQRHAPRYGEQSASDQRAPGAGAAAKRTRPTRRAAPKAWKPMTGCAPARGFRALAFGEPRNDNSIRLDMIAPAGAQLHLGARVAALAGPSQVLVTRTVTDLVAGSGLHFTERGEHELKGLPGSWPLYAVDL